MLARILAGTSLALSLTFAAPAHAVLLVGLQSGNQLVVVDSAAPTTVRSTCTVLLPGNPAILGIDQRPATGGLFAVTADAVYSLDPRNCSAILRGNFTPALVGAVGVDFNPTVDRIRVVTDSEQNLRLAPDTGALAGNDTALTPPGNTVAVAYDRNVVGAGVTTLFAIDSVSGQLLRQGGVDGNPSPNGGVLTVIGPLGVTPADANIGFEITPDGQAFATINVGGTTGLYSINLATGAATLIGTFATGAGVIGLSGGDLGVSVPTMSSLGLAALAGALVLVGMLFARRRRAL